MGKKNKKTLEKRVKALEKCITDMSGNMRTMADMLITAKYSPAARATTDNDECDCHDDDDCMAINCIKLDELVKLQDITTILSPYLGIRIRFILGDHMGDEIERSVILSSNVNCIGFRVAFEGIPVKDIDMLYHNDTNNTISVIVDHAVRYAMMGSDHRPGTDIEKIWCSITSYFVENDILEPFATARESSDIDPNIRIEVYNNREYPVDGYNTEYEVMNISIEVVSTDYIDGFNNSKEEN